jgi:predicted DNA binding CopG/RHH family protein
MYIRNRYSVSDGISGSKRLRDVFFEKQRRRMKKTKIPAFASETEEARWWYENRARLDKVFEEAASKGTLKRLGRETLAARSAASRVISIRLPEPDLARARKQAAAKGLPYQTYIKSLLHQALQREERTKAS